LREQAAQLVTIIPERVMPARAPRLDALFRLSAATCALALSVLLAGCTPPVQDPNATGSLSARQGEQSAHAAMEQWSARYQASPDRDTAINYAQALRANGQPAQAVAVLQEAMLRAPRDPSVAAAYGKALAANGDFDQALKVIHQANSPTNPDWRLLSAEGAINDQVGNWAAARAAYSTALRIAPDEPSVLNNLGLSYLLTNNLPQAEATLRKAAASPRADSRIRQNLALSLGLQGKFAEAEQVARAELSPEQADANVAYLKAMVAQQNTWRQIRQQAPAQPMPSKG
jgi:Flp pilus assembly protein TadD